MLFIADYYLIVHGNLVRYLTSTLALLHIQFVDSQEVVAGGAPAVMYLLYIRFVDHSSCCCNDRPLTLEIRGCSSCCLLITVANKQNCKILWRDQGVLNTQFKIYILLFLHFIILNRD